MYRYMWLVVYITCLESYVGRTSDVHENITVLDGLVQVELVPTGADCSLPCYAILAQKSPHGHSTFSSLYGYALRLGEGTHAVTNCQAYCLLYEVKCPISPE